MKRPITSALLAAALSLSLVVPAGAVSPPRQWRPSRPWGSSPGTAPET